MALEKEVWDSCLGHNNSSENWDQLVRDFSSTLNGKKLQQLLGWLVSKLLFGPNYALKLKLDCGSLFRAFCIIWASIFSCCWQFFNYHRDSNQHRWSDQSCHWNSVLDFSAISLATHYLASDQRIASLKSNAKINGSWASTTTSLLPPIKNEPDLN